MSNLASHSDTVFWIVTPYSLVEDHRHFGGRYHIHLNYQRVSQARKQQEGPNTEAVLSSETSVDSSQTTRRYIPEDHSVNKCLDFGACASRLYQDLGNSRQRFWTIPWNVHFSY
jgi:hypothetical protein